VIATPLRWRGVTRVVFRFFFLYFSLYIVFTQMLMSMLGSVLPLYLGRLLQSVIVPMSKLVAWTATRVFHVTQPLVTAGSGSGDKTYDWVQAFCFLIIAITGTLAWSLLDRRRQHYTSLYKWFHLFGRVALGSTMIGYGMSKAIPLQMPEPNLLRLIEPFGNFSPMGALWYSVGASRPYEIFTGCAELLGGILLFIPRTALLGALVCLADTIQIFMLNMTYDVPVKLFSFHLILLSLVLIAPDAKRLLAVLVLNRGAGPSPLPPLGRSRRVNGLLTAAQCLFGAYLVSVSITGSLQRWHTTGGGAPKPPLYGIWVVDETSPDDPALPVPSRAENWRRVIIQTADTIVFQRMDDTLVRYQSVVDLAARTLTMTKSGDAKWQARLVLDQPTRERLVLDGDMDGRHAHLTLTLFERSQFLLVSRGFHWIQEYPFNR
jgi:uncharacterized membrane protein YphA (DoxX/SURF4 family)